MSCADGTVEGTSQAEVPSTEGPLAVWCHAQLARAFGFDCISLSSCSFLKRAVAIPTARSRYSVFDVLIDKGIGFAVSLTEKCALHIVRVPYVEF